MLKKFLKLIKKNEIIKDEKKQSIDDGEGIVNIEKEVVEIERIEVDVKEYKNTEKEIIEDEIKEEKETDLIYSDTEKEFVKDAKIRRGRSIKSIDLYTKEEMVFKTHSECSRKLKIPIAYVKENLKYGYTDYLGEAINYLNKELQVGEGNSDLDYLNASKNPMEIYSNLNNRIFSARISESKRESILSNDKIEPINMYYTFECIDEDYDDYFIKYKSIIQRGGKKKIELVDKKGEAIEIFKSLDECSNYLKKDKRDIVDMLKYGETKVGRYEIRYSLRNI